MPTIGTGLQMRSLWETSFVIGVCWGHVSTIVKSAFCLQSALGQFSKRSLTRGCWHVAKKGSDRTSSRWFVASLLQSFLSPHQKGQQLLTRYWLVKMEMSATIMGRMWQNDWETSIDLKDVYLHIPMAQWSLKYLCFVVKWKYNSFAHFPLS